MIYVFGFVALLLLLQLSCVILQALYAGIVIINHYLCEWITLDRFMFVFVVAIVGTMIGLLTKPLWG